MNRKEFLQWALAASVLSPALARAQATLSPKEIAALNSAIQDEYKARATYAKVVENFGAVPPFSNIIQAETKHIAALSRLFQNYGLVVPQDTWAAKVPAFASIEAACAAAVQAEIDNAALYDSLVDGVTHPDLLQVFEALRRASIENHLPAFQARLSGGAAAAGPGARAGGMGGQQAMRGQGNGAGAGYGRGAAMGPMRGPGGGHGQGAGGQGRNGAGQGRGGGNGHGRGAGGPRNGR